MKILGRELKRLSNADFLHVFCAEELSANKQSELNLLTDEVERAQGRLLSLEREKVCMILLTS